MKINKLGLVRTGLCAAVFLTFAANHHVQASPQSEQLIRDGLLKLQAGDVASAGVLFSQAVDADPQDGKASFYLGVALNRIGQHGMALAAFQRMWDLKVTHRDLGFEGGWAALERGQYQTAITLLEPYLEANPDNAKAYEFIGRAYIGVGRLEEADAALNQALAHDPGLIASVRLAQGSIATIRGDNAAAAQALNDIIQYAPTSPLGTVLRSSAPRPETPKPWFVSGEISGGRNGNVIGLPDGALLPADVSSKSSEFITLKLGGGYQWRVDPLIAVTAGYDLATTFYNEVDGFDSASHTGYVAVSHRLREDLVVGGRLSATLQTQESDLAIRQFQLSPSLTYRWDNANYTEFSASLADSDFIDSPFTPFIDRDSFTTTFSGVHNMRVDAVRTDLRVGMFHQINNAEGTDFDYKGTGALVAARTQLPLELEGTASVSSTINRYDNLNSLAGAGFSFERTDVINQFALGVSRQVTLMDNRRVSVFGLFSETDNSSNITFFEYDQKIISFGVRAGF